MSPVRAGSGRHDVAFSSTCRCRVRIGAHGHAVPPMVPPHDGSVTERRLSTLDTIPTGRGDEAPFDPPAALPPPSPALRRAHRHPRAMHYNRLIAARAGDQRRRAWAAAAAGVVGRRRRRALEAIGAVAQANLVLAVLPRQAYVVNLVGWAGHAPVDDGGRGGCAGRSASTTTWGDCTSGPPSPARSGTSCSSPRSAPTGPRRTGRDDAERRARRRRRAPSSSAWSSRRCRGSGPAATTTSS